MRNHICRRGMQVSYARKFLSLPPISQSDVPEKWRAKALSDLDPSAIDTVCICPLAQSLVLIAEITSATLFLAVITVTLISASSTTTQVCSY